MSLLTIRARIREGHEAEVRQSVADVFAALAREEPPNLRYLSLGLTDGSYLILLDVEDDTVNPLPGMAEFRRFQDGLRSWAEEPAVPEPAQVVGSYRAF